MPMIRRVPLFVAALGLALALAACGDHRADRETGHGGGTSSASCVAPYLDDQGTGGSFGAPPPTVAPGGSITLHGHFYTETCNDTGGDDDPLVPMAPVTLTMTLPGGDALDLGSFTPSGDDMGFTTTVRLPGTTPDGTARVRDDVGHTYRFDVRS